ncbi:uncharacterized protein LOC122511853 [Leptopilina heterotoma]|uniref:uncharacterized protein LOC122511853 n=1 Tax=Leptopilina heterotoma TaxID=63436 RepID=UPI001CAA1D0B|nr:uncharacterized protein LOC122511853 [Leptopilina heterotoma]
MNTGLQFSSELSKIVMLPQIVDDDDMKKWVRKGRVTTQSECIELLLNYKNITCIMRLSQAELFVGFHMKQNIVKIVPEFIISVGIGYFLEPGSPYVEKLHRIYRLLCEFALLEKWRMKMVPNTTSHQLDIGPEGNLHKWDEKDDMRKVLFLLIGILIAGYVGSIILFFIELLFAKWKRGKN